MPVTCNTGAVTCTSDIANNNNGTVFSANDINIDINTVMINSIATNIGTNNSNTATNIISANNSTITILLTVFG